MKDQPLVPKELFDGIWKMKIHFLRAKFAKWRNQRVYFVAEEGSFPWKILEEEIKDPNHLPKDILVVNAIYTGQMWRKPGRGYFGESQERYTIMVFRDVLCEWINRKGERCTMTILNHTRRKNKKFTWAFDVAEVLAGGLTLKRIRAGFASSGRSSAEGSLQKKEPSAPRSTFALELEKWEKQTSR